MNGRLIMNELEKQRKDFVGGPSVVLLDGNPWSFCRPLSHFRMNDDGLTTRREWNLGTKYDELMLELEASSGMSMPVAQVIAIELRVAAMMLMRNYDLTWAEFGDLVRFAGGTTGDPEGMRLRDEIMNVAFGLSEVPKPLSDGSDSS
jgi:hypothetical protein